MNCKENKEQVTGACCSVLHRGRTSAQLVRSQRRDVINEMPRRKGSRGKGKEGREKQS